MPLKNTTFSIKEGLAAYVQAFSLIKKLNLWWYFILAGIISLLVAILLGLSVYNLADDLGGVLSSFWKWELGKTLVAKIADIFSGLVLFFIGLVLYKHLVMALLAPIMGFVSEATEKHLKGDFFQEPFTIKKTGYLLFRSLRLNGRNLVKELAFVVLLSFLALLPFVGIFFTIMIFFVQAYYAGFGNLDYTLERHLSYKESLWFVQKNRFMSIVIGSIFLLILMVPILGAVVAFPLSTVAATIASLKGLERIDSQRNKIT